MFSWDAAKSLKNYEQHGVSFDEAATAFDDPNALEVEDLEHLDALEQRWKRLGFSKDLIAIRISPRLLQQLRRLAAKQSKPYQTMIHEMLEEAVNKQVA
jgi:uncharacterized DUF497 family protein